jgi:hypothetical protein
MVTPVRPPPVLCVRGPCTARTRGAGIPQRSRGKKLDDGTTLRSEEKSWTTTLTLPPPSMIAPHVHQTSQRAAASPIADRRATACTTRLDTVEWPADADTSAELSAGTPAIAARCSIAAWPSVVHGSMQQLVNDCAPFQWVGSVDLSSLLPVSAPVAPCSVLGAPGPLSPAVNQTRKKELS